MIFKNFDRKWKTSKELKCDENWQQKKEREIFNVPFPPLPLAGVMIPQTRRVEHRTNFGKHLGENEALKCDNKSR